MSDFSKREVAILREALQFIIDKRKDYNNEREKLLSKVEGLFPTQEKGRSLGASRPSID